MYILGIETTGAFASSVLMKDDEILGYVQGNDRFSHLQNLMPQVKSVMESGGLPLKSLDVIAVSCGPGSFTGIRIGVSSARALSQILDIPCVAVSSLEALAMRAGAGAQDQGGGAKPQINDLSTGARKNACCEGTQSADIVGTGTDESLLICPMLDARRSQIYAGGYFLKEGYPSEQIKAGPYMLEEFLSKTEEYDRILLLGDSIDVYEDRIKQLRPAGTETAPESIRYQDAAFVARLGAKLYREKGGVSYSRVEPDYMRLAEAERKLREKQRKG